VEDLTALTWQARRLLAVRVDLDAGTERALSTDPEPRVRRFLAMRPGISSATQTALSADGDEGVRQELAKALRLTRAVALALAEDPDAAVRRALAGNLDTSEEVQLVLSDDSELWVRRDLAMNEGLTHAAGERLVRDQQGLVLSGLLSNPAFSLHAKLPVSFLEGDPRGKEVLTLALAQADFDIEAVRAFRADWAGTLEELLEVSEEFRQETT
jgi:hypothetical protein